MGTSSSGSLSSACARDLAGVGENDVCGSKAGDRVIEGSNGRDHICGGSGAGACCRYVCCHLIK